jgi:hypothetical protein
MKKKLISLSIALFLCSIFISCKDTILTEESNNNFSEVNTRELSYLDSDSIEKEELLFYTIADNYKLSENEVYNDLASFLALKDNDSSKNGNTSRSLGTTKAQYDISKVNAFSKVIAKINNTSRSSNYTEEVNFSIFDISNKNTGTSGIAITSDDERIGSLLCILDDINYSDTKDDPVLKIFLSNLDKYVEEVNNELESITENDIELFKQKYNITDEEIEEAKNAYENSLSSRKFWGYDNWSSWSVIDVNYNNLTAKTKWDQDGYYNDAIEALEGSFYYTGCGATAVAQIMAYHEFPSSYTRNDLSTLKSNWTLASSWNGIYDWKEMTKYPNAENLSTLGKICVGALMYDVSKSINSEYGPSEKRNGTSSNMTNRINYLRKIGYSCDDSQSYSYESISNSLHQDCPVMIRGNNDNAGHAWVIDGSLELQRTRNYYVFWIPFENKETQAYVHCNYGWSGSRDEGVAYTYKGIGYYKSGVFVRDYNQNLSICTNIKPNL